MIITLLKAVGLLCLAALVTSCDGDGQSAGLGSSGVARGKYTDELSESELRAFCTWGIESQGGSRTYTCPNGLSGTIYTVDQCVAEIGASPGHCQVGLGEDCIEGTHGDPCLVPTIAACVNWMKCLHP